MELTSKMIPRVACLRIVLIFKCLLLSIIAGALIITGGEFSITNDHLDSFVSLYQIFCVEAFVPIGIILIGTTCFGFFGAIRYNTVSLKLFIALLSAQVVVNVLISVATFVTLDSIEGHIDTKMFLSVKHFEEDASIRHSWNYVQQKYSCCGVRFPENWYGIKHDGVNGGIVLPYRGFTMRFPYTCCVDDNCTSSIVHEQGCANYVIDYIRGASLISAYSFILLAIVQIMTAALSYAIVTKLRRCENIEMFRKRFGCKSIILDSEKPMIHKLDV